MKQFLKCTLTLIFILLLANKGNSQGIIVLDLQNRQLAADRLSYTFDLMGRGDVATYTGANNDWTGMNVRFNIELPAGIDIKTGAGGSSGALLGSTYASTASVGILFPGVPSAPYTDKFSLNIQRDNLVNTELPTDGVTFARIATFTLVFTGPVAYLDQVQARLVNNANGSFWANQDDNTLRRAFNFVTSNFTLPIVLKSFTANKSASGEVVNLNWEVSEEINTKTYGIERSSDGVNYTVLNTQDATNAGSYSTIDIKPLDGMNYYRLYSIDQDGSKHYSGVRTVLFGNSPIGLVTISPNPLIGNGKLTVNVVQNTYTGAAQIVISDMKGSRVQVSKINLVKGTTTTSVLLASLSSGNYTLTLLDGNGNTIGESKKLIKQ